jgi:hypothetical protein
VAYEYLSFTGGHGMNLGPGRDSVKAVQWHAECSVNASRGSSVITDLSENDDALDATKATARFTFTKAGSYKICYKLYHNSAYERVGDTYVTLTTNSTPASDFKEILQNITYANVHSCDYWSGDTRMIYDTAYAIAIGIYDASHSGDLDRNAFAEGVLFHTTCTTIAGDIQITHGTTLPSKEADAVFEKTKLLTRKTLVGNITKVKNSTSSNANYHAHDDQPVPVPRINEVSISNPIEQEAEQVHVEPMLWFASGTFTVGETKDVAMLRGFGLRLGPGQDSAKVVTSSQHCTAQAADGTSVITDLGPGDAENANSAMVKLQFSVPGSYFLCYKLIGGKWSSVGSKLINVQASHREVKQEVGNLVPQCTQWIGDTKHIYEVGYARATGLHDGDGYHAGYFLHSHCKEARRALQGTKIAFTATLPAAGLEAVKAKQNAVAAAPAVLTSNISVAISEAKVEAQKQGKTIVVVAAPAAAALTVQPPVQQAHIVSSVSPVQWTSDGAVVTASPEQITVSDAFGLALAPGQDAMKVVSLDAYESVGCNASAAGGSSEVTNLSPGNNAGAMIAWATFTFTAAGQYKVCYKLAAGHYAVVGTNVLTVDPVYPSIVQYTPAQGQQLVEPNTAITLIFSTTMKLGMGTITLRSSNNGDQTIAVSPKATQNGQVAVSLVFELVRSFLN